VLAALLEPTRAPVSLQSHPQMIGADLHPELLGKVITDALH